MLDDGAEQPKKVSTGSTITKLKAGFLMFHVDDEKKPVPLLIKSVVSAKADRARCTVEIKTAKAKTFKVTFYIQSHLDFLAAQLPKHLPKPLQINRHPKDDTAEAMVRAPTVMKNPLVMIIPISEYTADSKMANLPGAKSDLGKYRSVYENEYGWKVEPKNGTEMYRKAFWTRSDILEFIKKHRGRLFEDGDEKEENEPFVCLYKTVSK